MAAVWAELKRRNVAKVAVAYAIVAWLLIQIIVSIEEPLNLPDWTDTFIIVLLSVGFVVALILAWAYELTPDGVRRTQSRPDTVAGSIGRKLDVAIISLLALALGFVALDSYVFEEGFVSGAISSDQGDRLPNSIAVLPLANLSPDEDDAYFAAGLHEEILTQLARSRTLSVISRTSVLRYADSGMSVPEIAAELNVETVMEGSVRFANDRVRITMQLIDAVTDEHMWAQTYDREFADIFAIESDIAMNVANALEAEFSDVAQASIERIPTTSADAYALYLRARSTGKFNVTSDSELVTAISYLDRALQLDAQFALAYAYKALLITNRGRGRGVVEDWEALAEDAALRALEVDPSLAWAHAALGGLYHARWQEQAAQREFELAYDLSPNEVHVLAAYAYFQWDVGQYDAALGQANRLVQLDPVGEEYPHYLIGLISLNALDYDAAEAGFNRHMGRFPGSANANMHLARIAVARGDSQEGIRLLRAAERLFGGENSFPASWLALMAEAYARANSPDDATRLIEALRERNQTVPVDNADWAVASLARSDYEEAVRRVRAAIDARELTPGSLQSIKANIYRDSLLDTPEWRELRDLIHPLE